MPSAVPMNEPLFTVVMPCYLGPYPTAASDRPSKLKRAIHSLLAQTCMDWELRLVADGCQETVDIYQENFSGSARISCHLIEKQPLWSGGPRNVGIARAQGQIITYLDADDQLRPEHLATIKRGIEDNPSPSGWWFTNDWVWDAKSKPPTFRERHCDPVKKFKHSTYNFIHRRDLNVLWPEVPNYEQDHFFGQELNKLGEGTRIPTAHYLVCHQPKPRHYDV